MVVGDPALTELYEITSDRLEATRRDGNHNRQEVILL